MQNLLNLFGVFGNYAYLACGKRISGCHRGWGLAKFLKIVEQIVTNERD